MRRLPLLFLVPLACESTPDVPLDASASCAVEGPDGFEPGETIADVPAVHCDGTEVSLRTLVACKPLTLVDVGAAAYRKCIEATDAYAKNPAFDDLQRRGLNIVQVFLYDESFAIPTLEFCTRYSTDHAVDFDFLIDPVGETGVFSSVSPLNLVVDSEGTILHKWSPEIPEDRLEILDMLLVERTP